jgi:hypothetical protein
MHRGHTVVIAVLDAIEMSVRVGAKLDALEEYQLGVNDNLHDVFSALMHEFLGDIRHDDNIKLCKFKG